MAYQKIEQYDDDITDKLVEHYRSIIEIVGETPQEKDF